MLNLIRRRGLQRPIRVSIFVQASLSEHLGKYNISRGTAFPTRLHVRPAKTQISLRIRTERSEYLLSAHRHFVSLAAHRVPMQRLGGG